MRKEIFCPDTALDLLMFNMKQGWPKCDFKGFHNSYHGYVCVTCRVDLVSQNMPYRLFGESRLRDSKTHEYID